MRSISLRAGSPSCRALITFVTDRPGHDFRYAIDFSRIRRELDWAPSISLVEGLLHTVDWYVANREWCAQVRSGGYRRYYDKQYGGRLR